MPLDAKDFGFWHALGHLRIRQVAGVEGVLALASGVGGGIAAQHLLSQADRVSLAGDYLLLAAALVGVVFAGFALVVGLMSDRYALVLSEEKDGVRAFLAPFLVSTGTQIGNVLVATAYRGFGQHLTQPYEAVFFGLTTGIFVYAALDVVALGRAVLAHGVTKAELSTIEALEATARGVRARKSQQGNGDPS